MPIYQRRVFSVAKPLEGVKSEDNIFTISHTGEQFKDENEYRVRCELYAQEVWACQCTGHTGFTHKQAWESEHRVRSMLEKSFPEFLHRPILSIVHHSTKSLDVLIDEAFNAVHSRLHKDEAVVCLKHDKAVGRVIEVTDPENVRGSPSSDKENKSGQPQPAPTTNGRFPSMLPLRYTVQLEATQTVIADLAPADLSRVERLPTRDLLRLFIRSSAVRQGTSPTAPWVVPPVLFVKHRLKNKIASIFLPSTPRKNNNSSKNMPPKKRTLENGKEKPAKKAKINGTLGGHAKASPLNRPAAAAAVKKVEPPDSDSDCELLSNIASSSKTKNVLKVKLSPKKDEYSSSMMVVISPIKERELSGLGGSAQPDSDDSDDIKLSVLAKSPKKKLTFTSKPNSIILFKKKGDSVTKEAPRSSVHKNHKKKGKIGTESKKNKASKEIKKQSSKRGPDKKANKGLKQASLLDMEKRKPGRPRKDDAKRMKQMSLFDLGKRKPATPQKSARSPQKSPTKTSPQKSPGKRSPQKPPGLPPCVRKLTREIMSGKKVHSHNPVLNLCVKVLKRAQFAQIAHEETRALIEKRCARLDEERLLSRMTPDQREEYMRRKKLELEEQRRAKLNEKRMRFEDQTLQLQTLPAAAPVPLPGGLPTAMFGQVAMVTEFLLAYSELLAPVSAAPVSASDLMEAVAGRQQHQKLLLDVVTMMLKVLLREEAVEDCRELSTPLSQIPATPQTASELVRLSLRGSVGGEAGSEADNGPDASQAIEDQLCDGVLVRLETCELFELPPEQVMEVLRVLVNRLLASDALSEHQEELDERLRRIWNRKHAVYRDRKAERRRGVNVEAAAAAPAPSLAAAPAAAPAPATDSAAAEPEPEPEPAPDDPASRARRSRRSVDEARRQRERQEAEKRDRRQAELQRLQKQRDEADVMREFDVVSAHHAVAQRRTALGLDRHHRRYWLLPSLPAALYVETGWADAGALQYRLPPPAGATAASDDEEQPLKVVQQRVAAQRKSGERRRVILASHRQATLPEPGENVWFRYTSTAQVDALISALAQKGERESTLRDALIANYATIKTMLSEQATVPESSAAGTSAKDRCLPSAPTPNAKPPSTPEPKSELDDRTIDVKHDTAIKAETTGSAETTSVAELGGSAEVSAEPEAGTGVAPDTELTGRTDAAQANVGPGVDGGAKAGSEPGGDATEACPEPGGDAIEAGLEPAGGSAAAGVEPSGLQFLLGSLQDDILSIEEELVEGRLGAVPDRAGWRERVLDARSVPALADTVVECQRHIGRHALQGPMALSADREQHWLTAVRQCGTLSRLHVLVGLLDSSIKWDLSTAKKKCRVCRSRDEGAVSLCVGCRQLYHWACLRPQLLQPPHDGWKCPSCLPRPQRQCNRAKPAHDSAAAEEEEKEARLPKKEDICRVCQQAEEEDMIFCTHCPAAFHKSCHDPPILLRVRAGWECMDCKGAPKKRSRKRGPAPPLPSELLRLSRAESDSSCRDDGDDEDEEEDGAAGREQQVEAESPPAVSSGRRRVPPRRYVSDDEDEPPPSRRQRSGGRRRRAPRRRAAVSESEEERQIRALSSDDESSAERRSRRSSAGRRAAIRHSGRRQPRKRYTERDESDIEAGPSSPAAEPAPVPVRPSPSKVDLIQQAGAVCMYCDLPRTLRNELAVCQSCPNLYHRRCASRAGLVDAWQCSVCVMPTVYRARPVKPRTSDDFEYGE